MKIVTNNHWRELSAFCELPMSVQPDFDYVDEWDRVSNRFVCYRGFWYDTHEFFRIHAMSESDPHAMRPEPGSPFEAWAGYQSNTFFSGIVLRYDEDFDRIQIGTYCE